MRILIHMGDPYTMENPCGKRMKVFSDIFILHGHEVIVLAPDHDQTIIGKENVRNCSTVKLKKKTPLNRLLNGLVLGLSTLFESFRVGKIDVVITTTPPPLISLFGWIVAKLKRAKLVYDVRDIWPDVAWEMGSFSQDNLYSRVFVFIRDFMLRHSDLISTVSQGKVKKLQQYAPKAKVIHITNGLDESFLKNEEDKSVCERYKLDQYFTCVYSGNLGLAQGLKQLLAVAKKAQEQVLPVRFFLFGKGVEEENLKRYVEENKLENVCFAGRIPNGQMYTVLKYAKLSFISLVNENLRDSVPTKMFEALGVGCPILLAAVGDSADILNECGLGIAVRPNDEKALWEGLLNIYTNHEEILKNCARARQIILEKYSRQKAAMLLEKYLTGKMIHV